MKVINAILILVIILGIACYVVPSIMYSYNMLDDNTIPSLMMLGTPLVLGPVLGLVLVIKAILKALGR